ncbi:SRPBCC domain-containing protein [Candidatus Woesebacteria bacterium]|nr:SRPBCC domain-containing protein [Candidatus Woesebacteria bacterium]
MISQTVIIPRSSAKEIYSLLLDTKLHTKLIGEPAIIKPGVGSDFSLYSGYATGKITKLIPGKVIEQSWRANDWPKDHYSQVKFVFKDVRGGTQINFTQMNVPKGTEEEFENGWQDFYWNPLIKYFS